jgi:hypothetical protein
MVTDNPQPRRAPNHDSATGEDSHDAKYAAHQGGPTLPILYSVRSALFIAGVLTVR